MVQLAYIGLGKMGYEMAIHIANELKRQGEPPLLIYNRTSSKAVELSKTAKHTKVVTTLEPIGQKADIIFSCLFDDKAVKMTLGSTLMEQLKPGCIIVGQATIAPETAYEMASLANKYNVFYLSCPVMGAPIKAKEGQLVAMLSGGTLDLRQRLCPYIDQVFGKTVIQVGNDVAASLRLKLCGNYFIFQLIESVAEGLTLGAAAPGVGEANVKQLIDALFPGTAFVDYSQRMVDQTYYQPARFSIDGGLKDASHILDLGKDVGLDLTTTKVFKQHLNELKTKRPDADISAVVGVLRESAGLDFDLNGK